MNSLPKFVQVEVIQVFLNVIRDLSLRILIA